jgi:hypothetical protein
MPSIQNVKNVIKIVISALLKMMKDAAGVILCKPFAFLLLATAFLNNLSP